MAFVPYLTAAMDVVMVSMLLGLAVDAGARSACLPPGRWLLSGALTWLGLAAALLAASDGLYILVMLLYLGLAIWQVCESGRLRVLGRMLVLALLTGFPLNTIVFVLSVCGIDLVSRERDPGLYALAALIGLGVVLWVWWQRRRYGDAFAVRFSPAEVVLTGVLFFFTTLLGLVLDPAQGLFDPLVLESESGCALVALLTVLVVGVNIAFLVLVWRSKTTAHYRQLSRVQAQIMASELRYFETYRQTQQDIRAFRHDMRHHLARLHQLCDDGDLAAVRSYLDRFDAEWRAAADRLYRTGDDNVDAILNGRAAHMRSAGITFTLDGAFARPLTLSPFDSCAIFANALDNAIEENERLADPAARAIRLTIRRSERFYHITMANPLAQAGPANRSRRTSKADPAYHGFGRASIRDKVEKNGGSIAVEEGGGQYQLHIYLPQ